MGKKKESSTPREKTAEELDRKLNPKFLIVYVLPTPIGAARIARTLSRTFETLDDMMIFANDTGVEEADMWKLGKPLDLKPTTAKVQETKTVSRWGAE